MIILASGSPRRKEILEKHGVTPTIIKPEVDEVIPSGFSSSLSVEQTVMFMALKKSLWVATKNINRHDAPAIGDSERNFRYIIAADTIVYDDKIIGKPADNDEAFSILSALRAKAHHVMTGVAVTNLMTNNTEILCDITKVYFKNYSDEDILEYIKSEPPLDKAGSYAIQGSWGKHIEKIEGDLENVIGLPYYRIKQLIYD